jgi:hypothetical protein
MRRGALCGLVAVGLALLGLPTASTAAVQPYGTHDAGGFRNVLPPGAKGVDNAVELAAFLTAGLYPSHWIDQ